MTKKEHEKNNTFTSKDIENLTISDLPNAQKEIKGEIVSRALTSFEKKAFARLSKDLVLDGFRKGSVPEPVAKKHIPESIVLEDMAELAIQQYYPIILTEHSIDAIGRPNVSITKLARDNNLGFTITTDTVPVIKLPDYKKLAKNAVSINEVFVNDEEVTKVVEELRQMRAYGHVHSSADETASHAHEEPLPEVDDAFAQSFGAFKTVEELRAKIKENILREKDQAEHDKRRIAIMDTLIKETTFDVPGVILASEQEKMLSQIESDIARSGMEFEEYLKQANKTREGIKEEYRDEATRRARFQLLINAIARDMEYVVPDEDVQKEAEQLMKQYPGADLERTKAYAEMMLTNEKILSMLEGQ